MLPEDVVEVGLANEFKGSLSNAGVSVFRETILHFKDDRFTTSIAVLPQDLIRASTPCCPCII